MADRRKFFDDDRPDDLINIVENYSPVLLKYLASRVGNLTEAQDLAQEAYLRLSRVPDADLILKPESYLFRIAANLANEFLLKRSRKMNTINLDTLTDNDGIEGEISFERHIEARSALRQLESILNDLPPLYRSILLLRKRDGFSHKEIAEKLDISPHTVHRYLTRALARCRSEWTE